VHCACSFALSMAIVCSFVGDEYDEVMCNSSDCLLRGFWSLVSEFVLMLFIYCLEFSSHIRTSDA
jgi:hypothetical protein